MSIRTYLGVARRWWWTVVSATLAASLSGYLAVNTVPKSYEAETHVLVGPVNAEFDTLRASALIVETYADLVTSEQSLNTVIGELGLQTTTADLADAVRTVANTTTRILTIEATQPDPVGAANVANALADNLLAQLGPAVTPAGRVEVIDEAIPIADPVAPNVLLLTALSGAAGFVAALILVLLMERLSSTINSRWELTELTGAPYLGTVRFRDGFRPTPTAPLFVEARPQSETSLSTRLVTGKIGLASAERPQVVAIVGSGAADGSGELAANVAAVLSRSAGHVILVDADDSAGEVSRLMGAESAVGVGDLLTERTKGALAPSLSGAMIRYSSTLSVLPLGSGRITLADRKDVERLVTELRRRAEMIVISAGPAHRSASTVVWAHAADMSVLVAQRDAAKRADVRYSVETLRLAGADIGGVVLVERRWALFAGGESRGARGAGRQRDRRTGRGAELREAPSDHRP